MSNTRYGFRRGRSAPVTAQAIGEEMERLGANDLPVAPTELVEVSRPEDAPLHPAFEWNDERAAELYRVDQARSLIRSVVVVPNEEEEEDGSPIQIAFVSVGTPGPNGQAGYIRTSTAMNDDGLRGRVLRDAVNQLHGWRLRFCHLQELAGIVAAIDDIEALV